MPDEDDHLQRVLAVVEDFESFGGSSLDLTAWELNVPSTAIQRLWQDAIDARLLEPGPLDDLDGTQMYRLAAVGRARLHA